MSKLWSVARREYLARVRSKGFVIGTILGPVLMAGLVLGPALLASRQLGKPVRLAILDESGALTPAVRDALGRQGEPDQPRFSVVDPGPGSIPEARERLRDQVLAGELDGYIYLPADALARSVGEYYGKNVSSPGDMRLIDRSLDEAFVRFRLSGHGLDVDRIQEATRTVELKTVRISATGEREDRGATFALAFVLMFMLYMSLALWGTDVMNSVIEEKSSRVVEVVASSVPASSFFLGKLLGVGGAGLTQFAVWSATLAGLGAYAGRPSVLGTAMPEVTPLLLASFLGFFVLGFMMYGALYATVGAAVNTVQEAQSLAFPVLSPLILSAVFAVVIMRSPESGLATVMSLVPLLTPILMFLRIAVITPPAWQIALSVVLTVLTVLAIVWLASRIYRVGILMYGKRPTLPEILRWLRHS